ncbi:MAG: TetR/AcrR family transcriptional regulator [Thermodesulfobacteriota bacterium]|nr:TetR/AcrR family transcriptional regulator [Thermodesulfobacteriota bacterium]
MGIKTFNNLNPKKQNNIFRIALVEFSDKGYAKASINDMVERLGIAKGSIFQYFGDKQGLFNFVFAKALTMVKEHFRRVREETENLDFFTRFETILVSGVGFVRKNPRIYALYTKIQFEGKLAFCSHLITSLRRDSFEYLSDFIKTGIKKRELSPDLDLARTSFLLDAVLDRFLQAYMLEHLDAGQGLFRADQGTTRERARQVVEMIRQGLESREHRE